MDAEQMGYRPKTDLEQWRENWFFFTNMQNFTSFLSKPRAFKRWKIGNFWAAMKLDSSLGVFKFSINRVR